MNFKFVTRLGDNSTHTNRRRGLTRINIATLLFDRNVTSGHNIMHNKKREGEREKIKNENLVLAIITTQIN